MRWITLGAAAAAMSLGRVALAQETYFVPGVSAGAEWNSNRQLSTDERSSAGYRAALEGYWKRNSPRTDFYLHPQINFQDYPNIDQQEKVGGLLELDTNHHTLKGLYSLTGRYTREDTLNAELGKAGFDNVDPEAPDTVGTGNVTGGITRTRYELEPSMSYSITELTDFEAKARWDSVKYESDLANERVGYDSPEVELYGVHAFGPRLRMAAGPYYTKFETDNDQNKTEGYGANVEMRYQWSEITRTTLAFNVEKDDVTTGSRKESRTNWGLRWLGQRRMRVGQVKYSIGRFLEPSSVGSRVTLDQVRVQYIRPLGPRFAIDSAVRLARSRTIGNATEGGDRDRANVEITTRTQLSRTLSLNIGYRYAFLDRKALDDSVQNHGVFVLFAFHGLDPHPE
jgi:hypothetical protein